MMMKVTSIKIRLIFIFYKVIFANIYKNKKIKKLYTKSHQNLPFLHIYEHSFVQSCLLFGMVILINGGFSRKKIYNNIAMYRVLLKVDRVRMKVREAVDLHIIIKKDHKHFTHCRDEPLRNGEGNPTNSSEFLIEAKNPKFELQICLAVGETRKRGGTVMINLRSYAANASHRITAPIKKTPLTDSTISLDFVYMPYEGTCEGEGLVSLQRAQELQHRRHLRQITEEHQKLVFHNSRLSEQVRKLKEKNDLLSSQQNSLQLSINQREEMFTEEIQFMERERERSLSNLENQKKRVAEIVEKINETGDNTLKEEVGRMINNNTTETSSAE